MIIRYALALSSLVLVLSAGPSYSGPCTQRIFELRSAAKEKVGAVVAAGRSGTESTEARLHHQPTPDSVAKVEEQLGEVSAKDKEAFFQAIDRANAADTDNNLAERENALTEAWRILRAASAERHVQ